MTDASCLESPVDNYYSCSTYPAWDLHNPALFNSDIFLAMESMITTPPYFSTLGCESYPSSGYLEDVLVDNGNPSKRKRSLLYTTDERALDSTYMWPNNGLSTWGSESRSRRGLEESMISREIQKQQEPSWTLDEADALDFSSSQTKYTCDEDKSSLFSVGTTLCQAQRMTKKRSTVLKKLVYPFALVKPGGEEGDITLNDINERMLVPPTRPIRHPVGDFVCRPSISQPHGPGLSGKAVVALTKIRTLGSGTVTIIRTKG